MTVVLLRGVNVGGHRRLRPSALANALAHLDVVSIGAAGTFVVRRPVDQADLRAEFARELPFDARLMICNGGEVTKLLAHDFYAHHVDRPDIVRFVSLLSEAPHDPPLVPMDLPASGEWLVRILAREGRFVIGLHRRQMRAIGQLGALDRVFAAPGAIRNWTTFQAIGRVLGAERAMRVE